MKKEYGLALLAVFLWSTLSPVTKIVLGSIPNMEALCVGSLIATIFLLIINAGRNKLQILRQWSPIDYIWVCGMGFVGLFLYYTFYYYGISVMAAQDACIINYLWPLMIVVFSVFILKEKMNVRKLLAVILSFAGVVLVATKGDIANIDMGNLKGILSCVGAAVCYGLFSVYNKKKAYDQNIGMMFFFGIAALASGAVSLLTEELQPITGVQLIGSVWIGVFVNAIAYLAWGLALNGGETAKISNLAYITPFLTMLVSYVLLGEPLSLWSFGGLVLIIAGIFIQMNPGKKRLKK